MPKQYKSTEIGIISPMESLPYLYFLDRNAISIIKDDNVGKRQTDPKKTKFLQDLRLIDRRGDYVSPLLSIIEGELGHGNTAQEKSKCQAADSDAVRRFFKLAKTDSNWSDEHSEIMGRVFTEYREGAWESREEFLKNVCPLIIQGVEKFKRKDTEDRLIALGRSAGLRTSDPILVLSLACLYGNNHARKVLKPKTLNTYNVLNDVHVISRIAYIKAVVRQANIPLRVRFVSMDEGLNNVLAYIRISDCRVNTAGELSMKIRYLPELFTELPSDCAIELSNHIAAENY